MANIRANRGLVNPRLKVGGEPRTETLLVGVTYGINFYPGQMCQRRADGRVIHLQTTVYKSAAGVVASYLQAPSAQSPPIGSTKDLNIQVVTDFVNTEWELQLSCAAGSPDGQTYIGNNVGFFANAILDDADPTRPFAPLLFGGTPGTGDRMFRVLGFVIDGVNEPNSANPRVRVEINPGFHERFSTQPVPGI